MLSNENIAKTVEDVENFFTKAKVSNHDVIKICLVVEEALIRCQERFGVGQDFKIYKKSLFGTPKITIRIKNEPYNPIQAYDDEETIFSNEIMQNLLHQDDAQTIYRYENGYNEIICTSTRERKPIKIPGGSLTIAIVLAIICSFFIGFLSQGVQSILISDVISPILSTLLNLIVTITIFMIFFSILSGICSIESGATLGNIGSTVLIRFLLIDLGIIALSMFVSQNFFPIESLGGENSMKLSVITELLLSIIPKNIPAAFMDKNILHVLRQKTY